MFLDNKHCYDQETDGDKDCTIGNVEDGKTLHDEIRKVHVDEVRHSAKDRSIHEIADRTANHQTKCYDLDAVRALPQKIEDKAQGNKGGDDEKHSVYSGVGKADAKCCARVCNVCKHKGIAKEIVQDGDAVIGHNEPAHQYLGELIQDQNYCRYDESGIFLDLCHSLASLTTLLVFHLFFAFNTLQGIGDDFQAGIRDDLATHIANAEDSILNATHRIVEEANLLSFAVHHLGGVFHEVCVRTLVSLMIGIRGEVSAAFACTDALLSAHVVDISHALFELFANQLFIIV